MRNKIGTLALTSLMVTVGLVAIAPPAAAGFACMPVVQVDSTHSPAGQWSTHTHPRFTFPLTNRDECDNWVATELYRSWSSAFRSSTDDYHPDLWSGEFYVQARVLYERLSWEYTFHCHLWSSDGVCLDVHWHGEWVWREVWTGWVTSPTVKIDVTAPHVEIAGINGPFVQGPDADYVTNETEIALAASDAHSGIDRFEYRIDDGAWQVYNGPTTITGDNGPHTFTYRAIDNVGLQTEKSRDFILDNTTPEQTMIRPNANSATFDGHAVETCNGTIRVTEGGEALVTAPDHREAVDNATAEAGKHLPVPPANPDQCAGDVVETKALGADTPKELDPVLNVTVDDQDFDFDPVYLVSGTVELELDVQDELVGTGNVSFLLDGEVQETQGNGDGVYLFQWDTSEVPAGAHEVTLQATDRLGNQGEWTFTTWVVSSTAPETLNPDVPEVPEVPT